MPSSLRRFFRFFSTRSTSREAKLTPGKLAVVLGVPTFAVALFCVAAAPELEPRQTFNAITYFVATGLFYLGCLVGVFLTFWLPGALSKSFKYHVGDVWPFIAFFICPFVALATGYVFSYPLRAWLS